MSTSLEKLVGGYLFIESLASIVYSQDQRSLSNFGRLGRMGIGAWLFFRCYQL